MEEAGLTDCMGYYSTIQFTSSVWFGSKSCSLVFSSESSYVFIFRPDAVLSQGEAALIEIKTKLLLHLFSKPSQAENIVVKSKAKPDQLK